MRKAFASVFSKLPGFSQLLGRARHGPKGETRCLLLSPATRFGSWSWCNDVMKFSPDDIVYDVVSFGEAAELAPSARLHKLPENNYPRLGQFMATKPFLLLNLFQYLPALPVTLAVIIKRRPEHLVANGVAAAAFLLPLKYLTGAKLHLWYHSFIGHMSPTIHKAMGFVLRRCDSIIVNSIDSRDDIAHAIDTSKVTVVDHWADPAFYEQPIREREPGPLRMLWVGRLTPDKFGQCLRVAKSLAAEGVLELWFAGDGWLRAETEGVEGMRDLGYITDRAELARAYASVDISWIPADTTYLGRPGYESLAAGTPIIAPDLPPVPGREHLVVPRDLIPEDVGFVFDGRDDSEVLGRLRELSRQGGTTPEQRIACRSYAEPTYSVTNIKLVTDHLS